MSRSRLKIPEPYRRWARAARKADWSITCDGSGHLLWTAPSGARVRTASTPGGPCAAVHKVREKLRKAGLAAA